MINQIVGLVIGDENNISLGELSKPRSLSAMPVGGRYRIIDFHLSNLVNSGVRTVGVSTLNRYKSLMDHLGSGSAWDLDRKNQGLYFLTPNVFNESFQGASDEISGLLSFYQERKEEYIIICGCDLIFTCNFEELFQFHIDKKADITCMYKRDGGKSISPGSLILDMGRGGKLKTVYKNPLEPVSNKQAMEVLVMRRDLFVSILAELVSLGKKDIIMEEFLKLCERLKVYCYEYKGTLLRIRSIKDFFNANISMLDDKVRTELFWSEYPVYTKVKDEAPAYYSAGSIVSNCLVSDGCNIKGQVRDSMLFRGVSVGGQSTLKNCIIFQNTQIAENCELENVIIDKDCKLSPGTKLVGQKAYPVVIGKRAVL